MLRLADLDIDPSAVGRSGARQELVALRSAPARASGELLTDDGTAHERIVEFLVDAKVL
jgi:hypothetical protein